MRRATSLALLLTLTGTGVRAQQAPATGDVPASGAEPTPLTSNELGNTQMSEALYVPRRLERIGEERREAFQDTVFKWELRSYDFDLTQFNGSKSVAWAAGGSVGFTIGYFRRFFAFGATGYASQPLYAPAGKGGTQLLQPDQTGYTVLGEAFARLLLAEGNYIELGRNGFDTPYINRNDSRMTPQTFEGAAFFGVHGDDGAPEWRYGGGISPGKSSGTRRRYKPSPM